MLKTFHKKLVVDEQGNPTEVIIPWAEFVEIAELLGLDLNEEAVRDLEQARHDRDTGKKKAFLDINTLAAQRDTSVSALLTGQLEALVKHDLEYQTAWAQWQELVQTLRLSNEGRPYPSRDEVHER